MLRKLAFLIAALACSERSRPFLAQQAGPNGGLLAGKGDHQTELVVSPTTLTVFILHDGKVDDTKASASGPWCRKEARPRRSTWSTRTENTS